MALYVPVLVRLLLSLWRVTLGNRDLPPLDTALKVGGFFLTYTREFGGKIPRLRFFKSGDQLAYTSSTL